MALELSGIHFAYSHGTPMEQPALVDVGMRVERGSVVLVAGATGSGKSTLLRIGAGLLTPQHGSMAIDGVPIAGAVAGTPGGVGLAFQSPESQLFAETVLGDVAFGPRNQGASEADADERARDALVRVGLDPETFGSRSPFALSGGEARRAAIAGVIALDPGYLMLDEPTAGLDAEGQRSVLELVLATKAHAGVIVVSHDLEAFLPVADHVVLLRDGAVSFSGPTETLIEDPDRLRAAGLAVPPVLEVLAIARERGARIERMTLDPVEACAELVRAGVVGS